LKGSPLDHLPAGTYDEGSPNRPVNLVQRGSCEGDTVLGDTRKGGGRNDDLRLPDDWIVEPAEYETDLCPACEGDTWFRIIATYDRGAFYSIFCGDCGKPIEERWTELL